MQEDDWRCGELGGDVDRRAEMQKKGWKGSAKSDVKAIKAEQEVIKAVNKRNKCKIMH
jgi:hypothetical protein